MTVITRHATFEEIHALYRQIPEFGGLHSLADLQQRVGPSACHLLTRNRFQAMLTMLIGHHYQIVQLEKKGEVADYRLLLEKTL